MAMVSEWPGLRSHTNMSLKYFRMKTLCPSLAYFRCHFQVALERIQFFSTSQSSSNAVILCRWLFSFSSPCLYTVNSSMFNSYRLPGCIVCCIMRYSRGWQVLQPTRPKEKMVRRDRKQASEACYVCGGCLYVKDNASRAA